MGSTKVMIKSKKYIFINEYSLILIITLFRVIGGNNGILEDYLDCGISPDIPLNTNEARFDTYHLFKVAYWISSNIAIAILDFSLLLPL